MKKKGVRSATSWLIIGCLALLAGCIGLLDPNDHNKGIIVGTYPQSAIDADKQSCYEPTIAYLSASSQTNVIIDSDSSFQAYFDPKSYYDSTRIIGRFPCRNYQVESIDFTKYTLLGNYASGGCDVAFTRTVERDDRARQYVYTIKVREAGLCKRLGYSMNWVLVPKLPAGYQVAFLIR